MIVLRPANERGHANHGWLDSWHSFSFADYYDEAHLNWGPLRVINEDRVSAGQGFGKHSHRDMEIISYVLDGALAHEDSMGTSSTIVPGEIQRMSAGTGVVHSEFNNNKTGATHFLQIWIVPARRGVVPSYEQKAIPREEMRGKLRVLVSPDGRNGSVTINQHALMMAGLFEGAESASYVLAPGRLAYAHLVKGEATINGHSLKSGDALMYREESIVSVAKGSGAEVLVFDLPAPASH